MALVNIQKVNGENMNSMKVNDAFSGFSAKFRWADDLDLPSDEIFLRVKYERYL